MYFMYFFFLHFALIGGITNLVDSIQLSFFSLRNSFKLEPIPVRTFQSFGI